MAGVPATGGRARGENVQEKGNRLQSFAGRIDRGRRLGESARMKTETIPTQSCPRCGLMMANIKGSRLAVCSRCGYKDDCC